MNDIITERSGSVLRLELNRPTKKNPMTSGMYLTLADLFKDAAKDERIRAVLWHGAGDSFCAGNDVEDILKNPPGPGASAQAQLMNALPISTSRWSQLFTVPPSEGEPPC
jgi:enoyl-CoA hydratase/carnithine racemase